MIILIISRAPGEIEPRAEKEFTVALEAKEYIRTSPEGSEFKVSIKQDETSEPKVTEFVSAQVARDAIDTATAPLPDNPPQE